MKNLNWRLVTGLIIISFGLLALLQNLNIIPSSGLLVAWLAIGLFAVSGAAFLSLLASDSRRNWWAVIPGVTLLALAALVFIGANTRIPEVYGSLMGTFFLAALGLAFLSVYLLDVSRWWAVIPAGTLVTLSLIPALADVLGDQTAVILFVGLAVTFGLLSILPNGSGKRLGWAVYPALGCLGMALFLFFAIGDQLRYAFPALLILAGVYLLVRSLNKKS